MRPNNINLLIFQSSRVMQGSRSRLRNGKRVGFKCGRAINEDLKKGICGLILEGFTGGAATLPVTVTMKTIFVVFSRAEYT